MKTMKNVEPHRPYLVLRHYSGLTFRYKSWAALWNCPIVNPYFYNSERLAHSDFRKPDPIRVYGCYENDWAWRYGAPRYVDFSLRWDNGDPVSEGDKLFDERAYCKRRRERQIRSSLREKRFSRVVWKNKLPIKRHLHYFHGVCVEEGEPPIRKKAQGNLRPCGYCDYDEDYRVIQKGWKAQSKRKHQWRPKGA